MRGSKFPYLVLVPMLALMAIFVVAPIIGSFVISLLDYNPLRSTGNVFVGLKNFAALFHDEIFGISFWNTLKYVVFVVVINLCFCLVISQVLCSLNSNKCRSLFRVLLFMPCVAPLVAVALVWQKSIFATNGGLLNQAIGILGMSPVNWLGNAAMLMPSIIIVSLWADVGYNTVIFIAGIQGIPSDYYEAAEIDGANAISRFFKITLPLLGRTFSFACATTLISQFQAFAQFSVMAKDGGIGRAGYVLGTYIYHLGFQRKEMGYAAAASVALFAVILVVTLVQQRLSRVDWGIDDEGNQRTKAYQIDCDRHRDHVHRVRGLYDALCVDAAQLLQNARGDHAGRQLPAQAIHL